MSQPLLTAGSDVLGARQGQRLSHGDFRYERTFRLPEREVTREAIVRFARSFDPQPFHLDERAARSTLLKGLSASGWHTCSLFMGSLQEGFLSQCQGPRLLAIDEIKWLFPVRPGDSIGGTIRARAIEMAAPWPGYGQVEFECSAETGKGRRVMIWKGRLALPGYDGPSESRPHDEAAPRISGSRQGSLAHFEDLTVGDGVELGTTQTTAAAIRSFIDEFKLASTIDDRSDRGDCEASGWHVAAIFMGRLVRFYLREAASLRSRHLPVPELGPSPGIRRLRWHAPVFADDTLTFRAWAERKSTFGAGSNWGLLVGGCAGLNQLGDPVISFEAQLLIERRAF